MKSARLRGLACVGLLAGSLLALGPARAGPDDGVAYGPVPPGIAGVVVSERDQALASMALVALEQPRAKSANWGGSDAARNLLVLLDGAGLKAVAERLAAGDVPAHARPHLLQVVASSPMPEADVLLARAAAETRPVLRMLAAHGLGVGRSPRAVPALAALARDPVPAVRIAALRSLFALESEQAVAARLEVAPDPEVGLLAARLRWHHRCGDASDDLRHIATEAWRAGRTVEVRMAAGQLLTLPRMETPAVLLLDVVREMGEPLLGGLLRYHLGLPWKGYDAAAERRLAIDAAFTLLERDDLEAAKRADLLDTCVYWIARPVAMDPYRRDPIPEIRLRRRLPDFGTAIVAPVVARLKAGHFEEPRAGVVLLRELGADTALPILRRLLAPRKEAPRFESRAESQQRQYLRTAASGVMQELGRIGDEDLARTLLAGEDPQALKIDVVRALARDDAPWVVPLLGEIVVGENRELRSYALDILEQRLEPEARAILVRDLFERVERPYDRMQPLAHRGDEAGFALLARALKDERSILRKAALHQFHRERNPRLCGRAGRLLLRGHEPDFDSPQEVQNYVYALLSAEPLRAVRYVKDNWERFPTDKMRRTSLQQLQETNGREARNEAIDLALTIARGEDHPAMLLSVAAVLEGFWKHRPAEVAAFWRRLLTADAVDLRRESVRALARSGAPDMSDLLLPLLEKALAHDAQDDEARFVSGQAFVRDVIDALRTQPWERVEGRLIDVALEPMNESTTRERAAQALLGRLSTTGRRRLMTWLDYTQAPEPPAEGAPPARPAPGAHAGGSLQLYLAAAVGEGATPAEAEILLQTLERELFAFYGPERLARLRHASLASVDAGAPIERLGALARGVAHTRHGPTIAGLLDLVFDLRFALYARTAVARQAATLRQAGPGAAAQWPSDIMNLAHRDVGGGDLFGMPRAVFRVLSQVKALADGSLASALAHVLGSAREDGRIASFPDLYLYRVLAVLWDKPTGAKYAAADAVYEYLRRLEPIDGPIDFFVEWQRAADESMGGRFEAAVRAQTIVVRILARGNQGDRSPGLWRFQRARLDALQGAAYADRGLEDQARERFRRAVLRAPNDPDVLNTVAWERAMAGFELGQAEAEARRATNLEARVDNRPSVNAADTLAYVLLFRGKPQAAIAVLEPRMREKEAAQDGLLHLHTAQMYAAAGRLEDAREALVEALTWDRALEAVVRTDPFLRAFGEGTRLQRVLDAAAEKRREHNLQ